MGTTAMAQFSFSNEKIYTLITTRGWLVYNPDNEAVVSSTASYKDFAVSAENTNCQWAIHKSKSGRRVTKLQKGAIYIKNGKKLIAR